MNTSQADHYFLKALDTFCWDRFETMESLNFALSYDEMHAAANCLMGRIQMFWIKDFRVAAHFFEMAIIGDKTYVDTYKFFSLLMIWIGDFNKAEELIEKGLKFKGMDKAVLYGRKSMIYEYEGRYDKAKKVLMKAYQFSFNETYTEYFDKELSRIKKKIKMRKKSVKRREE